MPIDVAAGAPEWLLDAVFYAVSPDRFARAPDPEGCAWDASAFEPWDAEPSHLAYKGGNLAGLVSRLDDVADLGVSALLLTPIHCATTNHRYKPIDHRHVDPLLGGDAAFAALRATTRARGLRLVLDGVFNHVGLGFAPFQDVLAYGERSPWRRWFRIDGWPLNPFDATHPANYRCWSDNRSMPELDFGNPAVRAYVVDVVEHWLRLGIDGWRFDAPERIRDAAFWREVRRRARAVNPEAYLLGEIWGDASPWLDGTQWDGVTSYPLLYALYRFAAGRRLRDEHLLPPSRGHQHPSDAPRFAADVEGLLARHAWPMPLAQLQFVSTHDVARFVTVAGGDRASLELATLLVFTLPGVPCIYYGDEVGMTGGLPPACRGGYPPRERWDQPLRDLHRRVAALRQRLAPLRRGRYRTVHAAGELLVFERAHEREAVLVAINAGDGPASTALDLGPAGADALLDAPWPAPALARAGAAWQVTVPGRSAALFRVARHPDAPGHAA